MSVELRGFEEFRRALRQLPEHLAQQSAHYVVDAANRANHEARANYPSRTGRLRDGLTVQPVSVSAVGSAVRLVNRNPLAHIFERGTAARHNRLGANRGVMPKGDVFIPAAIKARRQMYQRMADLLIANGFELHGFDSRVG